MEQDNCKNTLYKCSFSFLIFIGGIITSYVLYKIEHNIFGKTIKTLWLEIAVMGIGLAIGIFAKNEYSEKSKKRKKNKLHWVILNVVIIIIFMSITLYGVIKSPYNPIIWNFGIYIFVDVLTLFIEDFNDIIINKKNIVIKFLFVITVYLLFILEPLVFSHFTNAHTVKNTQKYLVDYGYDNPSYIDNIQTVHQLNYFFENDIKLKDDLEMVLYAYVFTTIKDNKKYAVAVSVISQKILANIEIIKGSRIDYYLLNRY